MGLTSNRILYSTSYMVQQPVQSIASIKISQPDVVKMNINGKIKTSVSTFQTATFQITFVVGSSGMNGSARRLGGYGIWR